MKKRGQMRDIADMFKAVVTGIIGLIFLSALTPLISQEIVKTFANLGVFLIVISILVAILSKVLKHI